MKTVINALHEVDFISFVFTVEEVGKRASIVLIATLAIPLPSAHPEFDRFIETEKSALEKIDKLATLLSLPKPPTRISLIR